MMLTLVPCVKIVKKKVAFEVLEEEFVLSSILNLNVTYALELSVIILGSINWMEKRPI